MKTTKLFAALCCTAMLFAACEKEEEETNASAKDIIVDGVTVSDSIDGHYYVNLGLSVKWATCNIGATKPSEAGNYYAWGETETKETYSWSNYKYGSGMYALTKYCNNGMFGTADNKTILEAEDDAATANLGSEWRMPTNDEWQELIDNCTWEWTTLNDVNGYMLTSKKNGNTLFLPAVGYRVEGVLVDASHCYWSSSLNASASHNAQYLYFKSSQYATNDTERSFGQTVRAVVK